MLSEKLKNVRMIPDFPKSGINFVDVSALTADAHLFRDVVNALQLSINDCVRDLAIVGVESRGFIFGAAVASALGLPFIMARKAGKLPSDTYSCSYTLEYGQATLEVNKVDIVPGRHYVIIDDLIATGGTLGALTKLIIDQGGLVDLVLSVYMLSALENAARHNILAEVKSLCVL